MSATIPLKDQLRCARRFYEEYRKPELLAICLTLEKLKDLEDVSIAVRGMDPPEVKRPVELPQPTVGQAGTANREITTSMQKSLL